MHSNFARYACNSPLGLALLDAKGMVEYSNPSLAALLGLQEGGFSGFLADTAGCAALKDAMARARTSREDQQFKTPSPIQKGRELTWRIMTAEGNGFIVEVRKQDETDHLRAALGKACFERSKALMRDRRAREMFFNVIEELPIFVYMQRRDYSVAYANKRTLAFYGAPNGRKCYEVFGGRADPCPHCPTFRVFDTGEPVDWQFTDNEGRTFHIYDYPFEDDTGEPLVMELGVDITELKRVEQKLFQAQKMRAIGVMAGGIAHDLNNNLVPIIFNIDYALGKATDTELAPPLSEALKAAYKAADLVEQVLEYSRQQNVSRAPLSLTPLTRENLGLLQASLPEHITLEADYAATRDCVLANTSQLQQVLLNLCRNAVQAMPSGGTLAVSLSNLSLDSRSEASPMELGLGEHLVLRVSDTGCGMTPEVQERIFEPFYTSKKKSGGTGMGLAVVHAIITSCGGSILVDSTPDQGTTFSVYLPCTTPEVKNLSSEERPAARATGRLLLVDDDPGALQAMKRVLRDAGFEVFTADDGSEGLKEYFRARGRFDLVITDQSMPGMNGMDMAARILEHDPGARVVICTGHVEPNLQAQADATGVAGFVMKPMSPRMLVKNVSKYCA